MYGSEPNQHRGISCVSPNSQIRFAKWKRVWGSRLQLLQMKRYNAIFILQVYKWLCKTKPFTMVGLKSSEEYSALKCPKPTVWNISNSMGVMFWKHLWRFWVVNMLKHRRNRNRFCCERKCGNTCWEEWWAVQISKGTKCTGWTSTAETDQKCASE